MDYPFGHPNHPHYRRNSDDESGGYRHDPSVYPPPPPSFGGPHSYPPPENYPPHQPSFGAGNHPYPQPGNYPPPPGNYPPPPGNYPPPPHMLGAYHSSHGSSRFDSEDYPPPPPQPHSYGGHHEDDESGHRFRPHMPNFIKEHLPGMKSDENTGYENESRPEFGSDLGDLERKPTSMLYCKASGDQYAVAIRDGKVILTYADPDDPTQHWIKDETFSIRVKDENGYPSFALVNKATKQVIKHPVRAHPVQLVPYKPGVLDGSILWTESGDLGQGFRTIRMVNNVRLVLDAFNGDKDHGGVRDGTILALYESWKGDNINQQWKLVRDCKFL